MKPCVLLDTIEFSPQKEQLKYVKTNRLCMIVYVPPNFRNGKLHSYSYATLTKTYPEKNLWKFTVHSHGAKHRIPSHIRYFYATVDLNKNTIQWHNYLKQTL